MKKLIKNMKYILPIFFFLFIFMSVDASFPTGSLSVSPTSISVGESITITITGEYSGGVREFTIYSNNKIILNRARRNRLVSDSMSWSREMNTPGNYLFCGVILMGSGQVKERFNTNCVEVEVKERGFDFQASCYVSPSSVKTNQQVLFMSSVDGNLGHHSYSWSGACTGNLRSCQRSFSVPGTYTANLSVTSEGKTKIASCLVKVEEETSSFMSGTLSVNSRTVYVNNPITITVTGYNSYGLSAIGAHHKGNWDIKDVSGTNSTKTWEVKESVPGTYRYCGMVKGKEDSGGNIITLKTTPYCIDVTVLAYSVIPTTQNECSYIGQRRCFNNKSFNICESTSSGLKWSSSKTCKGDTNYGYGSCNENQFPSWFCSNGNCLYECIGEEEYIEEFDCLNSLFVLLAKKENDNNWLKEFNLKREESFNLLVVLKNNTGKDLENVSLFLDFPDGVEYEGSNETKFEIIPKESTETLILKAKIKGFDGELAEISGRLVAGEIVEEDKIKINIEGGESRTAAIGPALRRFFSKWYSWLLLILAFFIVFYIFKSSKK